MRSPLSLLRQLRSHGGLWLFRWKERHRWHFISPREGPSRGFATFGTRSRIAFFNRHYLGETHTDGVNITTARNWNPLNIAQRARRLACKRGLVIFTRNTAPRSLREDLLKLDFFIPLIIPLTGSINDYARDLGSLAKANLRKIRSRGYRAEISTDASWAQEFYERYHRPSMQGRHGDDGSLFSPSDSAALFKDDRFEWLRVFDGDDCISACIGERQANAYHFQRTGWRDGSPALQSAGASAALYWFGVQRAIELGLPAFNQGGVMPCLENGLFIHKTAWGGRLLRTNYEYRSRFLLLDPAHTDARRFISEHSLVIRDPDERFFVISSHLPVEVPTYAAQAPYITAWFRLRDTPDATLAEATANQLMPIPLRPWFDAIPLTTPPGPSTPPTVAKTLPPAAA